MSIQTSLDPAEIPALGFVDILVNLSKKKQKPLYLDQFELVLIFATKE